MLVPTAKLTGFVFSSIFLFYLEKQDTFHMTFLKLIISPVLKDTSHHFQEFVSRQMTLFLVFALFFVLFAGGFMSTALMVMAYIIIYRKHKFYFFVVK